MQILRKGVGNHLVEGGASILKALRLQKLYGLTAPPDLGWGTIFHGNTAIQGEVVPVPYVSKAELLATKSQVVGGVHKPPAAVGNENPDDMNSLGDGDDISLQSEHVPLDKAIEIKMTVLHDPAAVPDLSSANPVSQGTESIPQGTDVPNTFGEVDVEEILTTFDATRAARGTQAALLELYAKPCATFRQDAAAKVAAIIATVVSPAEIEARLSTLAGVTG